MNNKLSKLCECKIMEFDLYARCRLTIYAIYNCCKTLVETQTHIHVDRNDL